MSDVLIHNRRARFQYQISESFEVGLALISNEATYIRKGHMDINGAYARVITNSKGQTEVWLVGSRIAHFEDADRSRKLLLKRKEISRLIGLVQAKSLTLLPLKIYSKKGKIKVELGIAKGKEHGDRREEIKKRDLDRQLRRTERER